LEILLRTWNFICQNNLSSLYANFIIRNGFFHFEPNTKLTQPERYGDIIYNFNKEGFRDKNYNPYSKGLNVILLGDSVAFGLGVNQSRIYSALLSNKLNGNPIQNVNIINFAIPGYGGNEQLAVLEKIGLDYRPNLVILNFYMNDYFDALRGEVTTVNRLVAIKNILLNKSMTYMRLRQIFDGLTYWLFHNMRRNYFIESLNDEEPKNIKKYLISHPNDKDVRAFEYLKRINLVIEQNGSKLLIIITPNEIQLFKNNYDLINERLAIFCKTNNIDFYDMLPDMRAYSAKAYLFNDGIHLAKRGHKFVSELLAKELQVRYYSKLKENH
jgi:lysophospholipase L1-like esterase